MAELEQLEIVIDVIDQFEDELDRLLAKLAEVEAAVQVVDDIRIDVDVRGEHELDELVAQLAALEAMDLSGVGDIVVGDKTVRRGGGGGRARLGRETRESMQSLIGQIDDLTASLSDSLSGLSDDSGDTSRNMRRAADAADDAAGGFLNASLRMSDVHNALARLVPMLLVIIGALPALAGALIAVAGAAIAAAAALGALTAFGALGLAAEMGGGDLGSGFEEMVSQVREDFLDAFMPLAERLAPLFEDAIDGLDKFFQAVANQGDALTDLADDARAFGQFLIDTVPAFLNDMARFVDATTEAFGVLAQIGDEIDVFGGLAGFLAEVLGPLTVFISQVVALLPHLLEMSVGFLKVTNAILFALNVILDIITIGGMFNETLGLLVASVLAVYGAVLLLNSALFKTAFAALVSAGRSIIQLIAYLAGYLGASGSAIASTLGLAASFKVLAAAIALTGIGALVVIFGEIAGAAASASTNIDQATQSLKEFQKQSNRLGKGNNPYADTNVQRGDVSGRSRFAGGNVNITVEGDADAETMRNQTQNALYRMERPRRSR